MAVWGENTGHQWVGLEEESGAGKIIYKAYVKKILRINYLV